MLIAQAGETTLISPAKCFHANDGLPAGPDMRAIPSTAVKPAEALRFSVARPSATLARMDFLWTPWRYAYVTGAHASADCIFCDAVRRKDDEKTGVIFRGERAFIILNTFPYTSGHLMIVPYEHV